MADNDSNGTPSSSEGGVPPCSKCGVNPRANRGSWCMECRRAYQKAYNDRVRKRPEERSAPCEECGKVMTWRSGTGPERVFCSPQCKGKNRDAIRRSRRYEDDPHYKLRADVVAERHELNKERKRRCGACKEIKDFDQFYRRGTGLGYICKPCFKIRYPRDPADLRKSAWKSSLRKYHLTVESWSELLISQQGRCAVCRIPMTEPHIDHDHTCCAEYGSCGKCVRGLLCGDCNVGLGKFRDDADRLRDALAYLEGYATLGL